MIHYFGIRHHSPNSAWQLLQCLERVQPSAVLIEGPSDLTELGLALATSDVTPPVAILSYTKEAPVQTILYPFAEYSPEYQGILWAKTHEKEFAFIDLPSEVFLALQLLEPLKEDEVAINIDMDSFWERNLEQEEDLETYKEGAIEYGRQLRQLQTREEKENTLRESFMCRQISAFQKKYKKESIVVVAGAYHIEGLQNGKAMTAAQEKKLPHLSSVSTLMPYSYYRLSERSGYGAGNKAPAYFEMLWQGIRANDRNKAMYEYFSTIAFCQRQHGNFASTAEVIEASRLAMVLASMKDSTYPILEDLRDSAITCMGQGQFAAISHACASAEIGIKIGEVRNRDFSTAIQDDFYRQLKEYKLEDYKSLETKYISLDLRENLRVKSEKLAWLDLNRSAFFNQLEVIGIHFAKNQKRNQENATWAESWRLQWTPEAEIELAECALKGDTIKQVTAFVLKEKLERATSVAEAANVIELACQCQMEEVVNGGVAILQTLGQENISLIDIGKALIPLSATIRFGNIRRVDGRCLESIVAQLFYRGCLIAVESSICDEQMVKSITEAMTILNEMTVYHDFVNEEKWIEALYELARRDDLNTELSGYATSILLERGILKEEELEQFLLRRLSKGIPAELGAGWFAGFSKRNHYVLFARMSLWKYLSDYIAELDDEEFKRALVCLRRAFCDFTSSEKNRIAENLGELWGIQKEDASEILNGEINLQQEELLEGLEDFDFEDLF